MVQTIKLYKCMKTTLKAYKSNMDTNSKVHKENAQYKLKVLKVSPPQNDEKL